MVSRVVWREVGGDVVLVRCRGTWDGPSRLPRPVLVVDDGRRAFRFPSLPEPAGTAGEWRAAFSVPAELRAHLETGLKLLVDEQELVLPAVEGAGERSPVVDAGSLAERRARRAEEAVRVEAERADRAESLSAELSVRLARAEARIADAEGEAEAASGVELAELERARQLAWAEGRRREELEAELGALLREAEEQRDRLSVRVLALELDRDEIRGRLRVRERGDLPRSRAARTSTATVGDTDVLRRERALVLGPRPVPVIAPAPLAPAPAPVRRPVPRPAPERFDAARARLRAVTPEATIDDPPGLFRRLLLAVRRWRSPRPDRRS